MNVTNKSSKKRRFSEKELQIIKETRIQLSAMRVPRDQWSRYIQEELNSRKRGKLIGDLLNPYAKKDSGFTSTIKSKLGKVFKRFLSRRLASQFDMPDDQIRKIMEMFSGSPEQMINDSMDPFGVFFPKLDKPNDDKLGKQGTFVVNRPDKKEKIIEFDDEE